jgi:hypothetical protein
MLVKMRKTCKGSQNGIHVQEYVQGTEYEVSDSLASVLIQAGEAEKVKPRKKKIESAPENKMAAPEENKKK